MTKHKAREANFDGLVGPTHNYAGIAPGNIASETHKGNVSHPREAALQGLSKMKFLADLGFWQGVLPPQERPHIPTLKRLGFVGNDAEVLAQAAKNAPKILSACSSATAMWTANAATVAPSADSGDGRVHFTPANLIANFHRSLEAQTTARALKAIFADENFFTHHEPLPGVAHFGDEGAANHTRFCCEYGESGVEFFVYGKAMSQPELAPKKFPARQTREASETIIRLHDLAPKSVVLAQQNPQAIDAGVFHNDVAAVGNGLFLFCHEKAFLDQRSVLRNLKNAVSAEVGKELCVVEILEKNISLQTAIETYLFNTQVVTLPSGQMAVIAPSECEENPVTKNYLNRLIADAQNPIGEVHYFDLRQSMRNGGGPACLRLRVVLTEDEKRHVLPGVFLDDALFDRLTVWVKKHYRENLAPVDLADPRLLVECRDALDELTQILGTGSIYEFQK